MPPRKPRTGGSRLGERRTLPLLALRDMVVFPGQVVPLFVGRRRSIAAIEAATEDLLVLAAQRDPANTDPEPGEIYEVGVVARIVQRTPMPDQLVKLLVEGVERCRIEAFAATEPALVVAVRPLPRLRSRSETELARLRRELLERLDRYGQLVDKLSAEQLDRLAAIADVDVFADRVAESLELPLEDRQLLLEVTEPGLRLEELIRLVEAAIELAEVERKIHHRVKAQMERNQREYYLNEQLKAIRAELGYGEDDGLEWQRLQEELAAKALPEHVRIRAEEELRRLRQMPPMAAEAVVLRGWLEWVLALPWVERRPLEIDLDRVQRVLEEDHYGLERVKERILEHLAVHKLSGDQHGPRLLFVGPPGVGKTSLARSIARALDLEFVRQSLGGIRDEAEIRGHRRTYVGALPGRIVQGLKRVQTANPVFLLDEIDKLAADFRGDPAAALLEVLDPEQNAAFMDLYLDVELDLSGVFFIATANTLQPIPRPLLDRLEVIELGSYTDRDKLEIARRHLVPRQLERTGLAGRVHFTRPALERIIHEYTREAGVRQLERRIEAILRKVAVEVVRRPPAGRIRIGRAEIVRRLGSPPYRRERPAPEPQVGIAQGLAWTEVGGELLVVEVTIVSGKGELVLTGKLGEVLRESARAAFSYVRSRASQLGLPPDFHRSVDIHVHLPEGAVPKDGPSAGVALVVALASALTGLPVRPGIAMTGEVTLRGRVLRVGGIQEKLLAAKRAGLGRVYLPEANLPDLEELPPELREELEILPLRHVDELLEAVFLHEGPSLREYLRRRGIRPPLAGHPHGELRVN